MRSRNIRCKTKTADRLGEPVAWGGPIVKDTQQELRLAFDELQRDTFIKHP
jgi:hypothetical protein